MKDELDLIDTHTTDNDSAHELEQLLIQPTEKRGIDTADCVQGAVIGTLIAFQDGDQPLITYPGQPGTAALTARAAVDLYAEHIGQQVVLVFENGDPLKPIITGWIRVPSPWPALDRPLQVDVDSEGRRLTLTAREQLVLRCGKASITLTSAGKLLIQGAYVSSQSTGVNRIKGGSVQLN